MGWKAIILAVLLFPGLAGVSPGMPFVRPFDPKAYGGESQNWALAQDLRGVIYAGNNLGVLSYDGARWTLLPTPSQTVVRSLATDRQGRVYVGAVGELGYLESGRKGDLRYVSISHRLPEEHRTFTDVWNCLAGPDGVLFQSREQLMLWDGASFRVWRSPKSFHGAFLAAGRFFVRQREVGLVELRGGELHLLEGENPFATESIWAMLETPRGILAVSRNVGLWRVVGQRLEPLKGSVDRWLKDNAVYTGCLLPDGTLALGSLRDGVAIATADGELKGVLNRGSGLPSENVKRLMVDRDGALWAALDHGLARIAWPSRFTLADERAGLRGTIWNLHRHRGRLYAAMGQGVARLDPGTKAFRPRWESIPGIAAQCIAFLSLGDHLLLATAQGVVEVKDDHIEFVHPSGPTAISLLASTRFPGRVYAGMQGGLVLFRRGGNRWIDEGVVPGLAADCYSLLEDQDGSLWAGTQGQGVYRIRFKPDGTRELRSYGAKEGLNSPVQPSLFWVGGQVHSGSRDGILRYDPASDRWRPAEAFQSLLPGGVGWVKALRVCSDGRIWLHLQRGERRLTGLAVPGPGGQYRWEGRGLERLPEIPVECFWEDDDGTIWLGGAEGLVRVEPGKTAFELPKPLLQRVLTQRGRFLLSPGEVHSEMPVLGTWEASLRFEFALPTYDHPETTRYRTFLEGLDRDWSPWTTEAQREVTGLWERTYRLRLQAAGPGGALSGETVYAFRVRPPWYRTPWAFALWLVAGAGCLRAIVHWRLRALRSRNAALARSVSEATEQLRAQAAELARLNEEKNLFMGMVAHDLRNPIGAIQLTSELLEEADEPRERQHWAHQIGLEARDMNHLVERFLDIAAIDSGRVLPEPEPLLLEPLLKEVLSRHERRASRKEQRLLSEIPEGILSCTTDGRFLRTVLDNLLSNAVKFTPKGGAIRLRAEGDAARVRIHIEDEGPGLSAEDKARLFQRFTPLSARPTGGEKSTGLGLAISKRFAEAIHGTLTFTSSMGGGACFTVTLPLDWPE